MSVRLKLLTTACISSLTIACSSQHMTDDDTTGLPEVGSGYAPVGATMSETGQFESVSYDSDYCGNNGYSSSECYWRGGNLYLNGELIHRSVDLTDKDHFSSDAIYHRRHRDKSTQPAVYSK